MKIKMRWQYDILNGATIPEFARMEMRPSVPNYMGVYVDKVTIPVCSLSGYLLLIHIALGKDGYHMSTEYETDTGGGGSWPSSRGKIYKTKNSAFEAGINNFMKCEYFKQFISQLNRALAIFHSSSDIQLTLF